MTSLEFAIRASAMSRPRTKTRALRSTLTMRTTLFRRYSDACERLTRAGKANVLRGFRCTITHGRAAINMELRELILFLETGRWLNRYEVAALQTGKKGRALRDEVAQRLSEWGPPRLAVEALLALGPATHYAYLNIGGIGPSYYGPCCVVLEMRRWDTRATCFRGDTLRGSWQRSASALLAEDQVTSRFAAAQDLALLAVAEYEDFLAGQRFCLDRSAARALLGAEGTLMELHLPGPVARNQILEVRISKKKFVELCALAHKLGRAPSSDAMEFDEARAFQAVLDLLDRYEVPLVVEEAS